MENYNEAQICERIAALNAKIEADDQTGTLSDAEYHQCCQKLHDSENDLRNLYIQRYLAQKKEPVELDMSLYPFYEEESDSNMESCKERKEASIYPSYKKNDSLQK